MNIQRAFMVLTIGIFITLFLPLNAGTTEVSGDIAVDTQWTESLSPYVITGNISIARDTTLKIEPGVVVKFRKSSSSQTSSVEGYRIRVDGTLDARGADNNPILFTSEDKDQYWGCIEFTEDSAAWNETGAQGCILSHCIIERGGNVASDPNHGLAALRSVSASPFITDSIIRYSKKDGIAVFFGHPSITRNRIHDTACGITLITPEGGLIENNYLLDNEQGISIESGTDTIEVKNNTVRSSSQETYGGCLGLDISYHNDLSSFFWEQVAGPKVVLHDPNDVKPTFTAPAVSGHDTLTFKLVVTNSKGLVSAAQTVNITVAGENTPPVADAGPDQTAGQSHEKKCISSIGQLLDSLQ